MTWLRSLTGCRRGATALEAAFVLPLLLLVILSVVELGRLAWTKSALDFAVQEAARCAAVRPTVCSNPTTTAQFAAGKVAAVGVPAGAFTVALGQPCGVRVSAVWRHRFLAASLFPAAPTLTAAVCRA